MLQPASTQSPVRTFSDVHRRRAVDGRTVVHSVVQEVVMRNHVVRAVVATCLLFGASGADAQFTRTVIDLPGATFTAAYGR